jgi:hypothetical protein
MNFEHWICIDKNCPQAQLLEKGCTPVNLGVDFPFLMFQCHVVSTDDQVYLHLQIPSAQDRTVLGEWWIPHHKVVLVTKGVTCKSLGFAQAVEP